MPPEIMKDSEGKLLCPICSESMDSITRGYYEHLEWNEALKKYCKTERPGDTQKPFCGECGGEIESEYALLFEEMKTNETKIGITKEKRKELEKVILYDVEALKDGLITGNRKDFDYHFKLLKGNLKDYFSAIPNGEI